MLGPDGEPSFRSWSSSVPSQFQTASARVPEFVVLKCRDPLAIQQRRGIFKNTSSLDVMNTVEHVDYSVTSNITTAAKRGFEISAMARRRTRCSSALSILKIRLFRDRTMSPRVAAPLPSPPHHGRAPQQARARRHRRLPERARTRHSRTTCPRDFALLSRSLWGRLPAEAAAPPCRAHDV